jgi:hypothetical protein
LAVEGLHVVICNLTVAILIHAAEPILDASGARLVLEIVRLWGAAQTLGNLLGKQEPNEISILHCVRLGIVAQHSMREYSLDDSIAET